MDGLWYIQIGTVMKRNVIEYRSKEFVKIIKRKNEILNQMRSVPKRKLKEPFQDGWVLYLMLSDENFRRKDGPARAMAVDLVAVERGTRDSKVITKMRKNLTMENARSIFTYRNWKGELSYHGPHVTSLKEKEWKALDPTVAKFFYKHERKWIMKWNGQEVTDVTYRLNMPESALKVKVKKRMVTEIGGIDPDLEAELSWLNFQLEEYYRYAPKHRSGYDPAKAPLERKHSKAAINKLKKGEIGEITEYKKLSQLKAEL